MQVLKPEEDILTNTSNTGVTKLATYTESTKKDVEGVFGDENICKITAHIESIDEYIDKLNLNENNPDIKHKTNKQTGGKVTEISGETAEKIISMFPDDFSNLELSTGIKKVLTDVLHLNLQDTILTKLKTKSIYILKHDIINSEKIFSKESTNRFKGLTEEQCELIILHNMGWDYIDIIKNNILIHLEKAFFQNPDNKKLEDLLNNGYMKIIMKDFYKYINKKVGDYPEEVKIGVVSYIYRKYFDEFNKYIFETFLFEILKIDQAEIKKIIDFNNEIVYRKEFDLEKSFYNIDYPDHIQISHLDKQEANERSKLHFENKLSNLQNIYEQYLGDFLSDYISNEADILISTKREKLILAKILINKATDFNNSFLIDELINNIKNIIKLKGKLGQESDLQKINLGKREIEIIINNIKQFLGFFHGQTIIKGKDRFEYPKIEIDYFMKRNKGVEYSILAITREILDILNKDELSFNKIEKINKTIADLNEKNTLLENSIKIEEDKIILNNTYIEKLKVDISKINPQIEALKKMKEKKDKEAKQFTNIIKGIVDKKEVKKTGIKMGGVLYTIEDALDIKLEDKLKRVKKENLYTKENEASTNKIINLRSQIIDTKDMELTLNKLETDYKVLEVKVIDIKKGLFNAIGKTAKEITI